MMLHQPPRAPSPPQTARRADRSGRAEARRRRTGGQPLAGPDGLRAGRRADARRRRTEGQGSRADMPRRAVGPTASSITQGGADKTSNLSPYTRTHTRTRARARARAHARTGGRADSPSPAHRERTGKPSHSFGVLPPAPGQEASRSAGRPRASTHPPRPLFLPTGEYAHLLRHGDELVVEGRHLRVVFDHPTKEECVCRWVE